MITGKRGQPTKLLDDAVKNTILEYISNGNYIATACQAAGIKYSTYNNWERWANEYEADPSNGNSNKKIYFDFFEELKEAESKAEVDIVQDVRTAGRKPQYWAAGMTMLERKYRDRWGRQETPIVESKVLIALQDRMGTLKHFAESPLSETKQIPQEGVTDKEE